MPRALLPSLLSLVLLAAACGGGATESAERSVPDPTGSATARPDPSPAPPTSTGPSQSPTQTAEATKKARAKRGGTKVAPPSLAVRADASHAHLLTASALPLLKGEEWTVRSTAPEESQAVGACQKTALVDIGAVRAVRRDFSGPDDSSVAATQVVARFADAKSAWRAHEVLRAWRDDCADRLDRPADDVGPMREVALGAGTGGHYRSTTGTRKSPRAAGLGIVRHGRWLSVVELSAAEEDYPTRRQPSRRAVRRIAATFA